MRNIKLAVLAFLLFTTMTGCASINNIFHKKPTSTEVWWGTKQEIIDFLNSPQATKERWYIEATG